MKRSLSTLLPGTCQTRNRVRSLACLLLVYEVGKARISPVEAGRRTGISIYTTRCYRTGRLVPGLLIGAPGEDRSRGRAYLLRGGANADSIPDLVFEGEQAADMFGWTLAVLGDVNGDGHVDFGIGAPLNDAAGHDAGRVDVYFAGAGLDSRADLVLAGRRPNQRFGHSLRGVGCYVFFGGPAMDAEVDLELAPDALHRALGTVVAGIGDFNGDGDADFALHSAGAENRGRVDVFFGSKTLDARPDLTLEGRAAGEHLGMALSAADLNALRPRSPSSSCIRCPMHRHQAPSTPQTEIRRAAPPTMT